MAEEGLLGNRSFRSLVVSRTVGQAAQNALLYALLILVVERSESSVQSTLLVISFIAPSILLGIPAGVLAEVLPRRPLLVLGYLLRTAVVGAMLYYRDDLGFIYLLLFALATVGQFTGPAESAALPLLVPPERLPAGNSLLVLSVMAGQLAGAVILAPFLLKLLGVEPVLGVAAALYLIAAVDVSGVAFPATPRAGRHEIEGDRLGLAGALAEGWRALRSSRPAFMAMVYITIAGTMMKGLVVLAPPYTRDILRISSENTVFVMAPAAIGALTALLLTPLLARFLGSHRAAALGFVVFMLGMIALGLVVQVRSFILANLDLGISFVEERVGVSSVITVAMIIAIPAGLGATMTTVASRAVLNERAPAGTQARVFATQSALSDALSLVPLLILGAAADLAGVRSVLLVASIAGLLAAAYLSVSRRFAPPVVEQPAGAG